MTYGFCECGCGERVENRFVHNHHNRKSPVQYVVSDAGCWLWQRALTDGYGSMGIGNGRTRKAHLYFYEQEFGPIPPDHEVHHTCGIRRCVNPDHLEALTRLEHRRRHPRTRPEGSMDYKVEFFDGPRRKYEIDGIQVPSVTQILGVLDKPGLVWWGQTVALEALCELAKRHDSSTIVNPETDPEKLMAWIVSEKLSVNHVKSKAAVRGTGVHDALQQFCDTGAIPSLSDFAHEEQGFVQALCAFLVDHDPEPIRTEQVVGSRKHMFAGRYDLRCKIGKREGILDLKTGKKLHPPVHFQNAAYAMADYEMGSSPCDVTWALRASVDGSYELVETRAGAVDFLAVKSAYDALATVKAAISADAKQAKAELKAAA